MRSAKNYNTLHWGKICFELRICFLSQENFSPRFFFLSQDCNIQGDWHKIIIIIIISKQVKLSCHKNDTILNHKKFRTPSVIKHILFEFKNFSSWSECFFFSAQK